MIASRFAPVVCVLLGFALIPTIIHEYVGVTSEDGLVTTAVDMRLAGLSGAATGRKSPWAQRKFESTDWIERWYTGDNERVELLIARSYDLKRLYHHPELAILQWDGLVSRGTVRLTDRAALPIHVFESQQTNGRSIAMYALLYGAEFVDDPIWFQLRTATSLLVGGQRQMTLFFANDTDVPSDAPLDDLPVTRLLFAAIDSFVNQPVTNRSATLSRRSVPTAQVVDLPEK